jgi:hypothetical protein
MLEQNRKISDYINLSCYHDNGYTGKGVNVCLLETDSDHRKVVVKSLRQSAPGCKITFVTPYTNTCADILKSEANIVTVSLTKQQMTPAESLSLVNNGITLFAAAGNDSSEGLVPAAKDPSWISVGALQLYNGVPKLLSYSSIGAELDTVAFIPYIEGTHTYQPAGTSFAGPFLAGMIACYFQYYKEVYGRFPAQPEVLDLIKNYSKDLDTSGWDIKTGYGMLILPQIQKEQKLASKIIMDIPVQLINDRVMVPVPFMAEAFGGTVSWDEATQTATFVVNGKTIKAVLGSNILEVI